MSDCAGQHLTLKLKQPEQDLGRQTTLIFCKSGIQLSTWVHSQLESAGKISLVQI